MRRARHSSAVRSNTSADKQPGPGFPLLLYLAMTEPRPGLRWSNVRLGHHPRSPDAVPHLSRHFPDGRPIRPRPDSFLAGAPGQYVQPRMRRVGDADSRHFRIPAPASAIVCLLSIHDNNFPFNGVPRAAQAMGCLPRGRCRRSPSARHKSGSFESMSSTMILGGRRVCAVSIYRLAGSARAARFSSRVSHSVSKRPIWLAEAA